MPKTKQVKAKVEKVTEGVSRRLDWQEVPIAKIKPYANNPKAHTQEQVDFVAKMITDYGWTQPLCVDKNYELIFGHCRLESAKQIGESSVPCVFREDLSEAQVKALRIADNKSNESGWIAERLEVEFIELEELGMEIEDTGFSIDERNANAKYTAEEDDFDVDEALDEEPITQTGDLWLLGEHRVLCGDSTNKADVERLMDGKKAGLCLTDPPYNLDKQFAGEKLSDTEFYEFHNSWLSNIQSVVPPDRSWYVTFGCRYLWPMANIVCKVLSNPRLLIWYKPDQHGVGGGDFFYNFEPIFYGSMSGDMEIRNYQGEYNRDVWNIGKALKKDGGYEHPTAKPITLFSTAILTSSMRLDIVLDPFLGSGTTLIAADQLDRICFGMEIAPVYCDVIAKRYINHKGNSDGVFLERDGEKILYSEVIANV